MGNCGKIEDIRFKYKERSKKTSKFWIGRRSFHESCSRKIEIVWLTLWSLFFWGVNRTTKPNHLLANTEPENNRKIRRDNSFKCCEFSRFSLSAYHLFRFMQHFFSGWTNALRNRSKRVRTPVALLRSLSSKYPWGKGMNPLILPAMG